jgi:hypothetical protein
MQKSIYNLHYMLIVSLNISLATSKYHPLEIFCNLFLIDYILHMTYKYVYIPFPRAG